MNMKLQVTFENGETAIVENIFSISSDAEHGHRFYAREGITTFPATVGNIVSIDPVHNLTIEVRKKLYGGSPIATFHNFEDWLEAAQSGWSELPAVTEFQILSCELVPYDYETGTFPTYTRVRRFYAIVILRLNNGHYIRLTGEESDVKETVLLFAQHSMEIWLRFGKSSM